MTTRKVILHSAARLAVMLTLALSTPVLADSYTTLAQATETAIASNDVSPDRAPANTASVTDGSASASKPASASTGASHNTSIVDDTATATGLNLKGPARRFLAYEAPNWEWMAVQ